MLALRLPAEIDARLNALAKRTGRSKSFYAREAIAAHLDDLEDIHLAERRPDARLAERGDTVSLSELTERFGLEEFVRRRVASGLYDDASEVIRDGLRLLIEREGTAARSRPGSAPSKQALRAQLAELEGALREKGVASLALFGSVIHGDARPDSDVDILVDIEPGFQFSLVDLAAIRNLLEERTGRRIDVMTRDGLDPVIRQRVVDEAEAVF